MAIITLTTDLGLKDHYVSAIKGSILSQLPDVNIVDISHQIPTYNILDAAYILKNAYPNFPKGSIHIIGVKDEQIDEQSKQSQYVIVLADGHFFIGTNNGIFSLLLDNPPEKIFEINGTANAVSSFATRDIFAKVACHLAKGGAIEEIAKIKTNLLERMPFRAASMEDMIRGSVVYIDSYGNVITNIHKTLFDQIGKGRSMVIELKSTDINRLSKIYSDVPEGEVLALLNSSDFMEIAINTGKANELLYMKINDTITVRFQ
jgi:S-adenosylmethionine hydrolase